MTLLPTYYLSHSAAKINMGSSKRRTHGQTPLSSKRRVQDSVRHVASPDSRITNIYNVQQSKGRTTRSMKLGLRERVFHAVELLEHILLQAPARTLLVAMVVNRRFCDLIATSAQ